MPEHKREIPVMLPMEEGHCLFFFFLQQTMTVETVHLDHLAAVKRL